MSAVVHAAYATNGDPMSRPIQLHGDLTVDPAREVEMVRYFETVYRPKARDFPGYIDLHLLKLTGAPVGTPPPGLSYRFSITYESEALRLAWVSSDVHSEVWGTLESFLTSRDFTFLLFDVL
jgi:hypothetical protein